MAAGGSWASQGASQSCLGVAVGRCGLWGHTCPSPRWCCAPQTPGLCPPPPREEPLVCPPPALSGPGCPELVHLGWGRARVPAHTIPFLRISSCHCHQSGSIQWLLLRVTKKGLWELLCFIQLWSGWTRFKSRNERTVETKSSHSHSSLSFSTNR